MAFFYTEEKSSKKTSKIPVHTARELECKVCPLTKINNYHPKMEPEGTDKPVLYILRNFPTLEDDKKGEYLTDKAGDMVLNNLPKEWDEVTRTNAILRCFPEDVQNDIALECCKKSIVKDIEETKPFLILGLGAEVLHWIVGNAGIYRWRGRFIPVKVGNHVCWFYPIYDPEEIVKKRRTKRDKRTDKIIVVKNEWDALFVKDLERLLRVLEDDELEDPVVIEDGYLDGIEWTEGNRSDKELKKVLGWLDELQKNAENGLDIETSCIRPYEKDALLITIAIGTIDKTYAFPLEYPNAWTRSQLKLLWAALEEFNLNSGKKIAHNLKFEQEWLAVKQGDHVISKDTEWDDTMAQAYALDERRGMHSLEMGVQLAFGFDLKKLSNIDRKRMLEYPLKKILPYNGLDTKYTHALYHHQRKRLKKYPTLQKVSDRLVRTSATLARAQKEGIVVDQVLQNDLYISSNKGMHQLIRKIQKTKEVEEYQKKFGTFNPGSPDHVLKLLQRIVGLDEELKNKKGAYTSDAVVLHKLKDLEFASLILEYRGVAKKASTYITPLREGVYNDYDGKIHTNYNLYITSTGRLSSNDPNMQNWPNRKGKEIRRLIVAPEGSWLVCADYGQIEARILGVISQDKVFCEAMWNDYDVHLEWAERIARAYPAVIGGAEYLEDKKRLNLFRKDIKNQFVFPAFYGSSVYSIAAGVGVPIEIMLDLFRDFWNTFRGIKAWQKRTVEFYNKHGYVQTLTGRRRHNPLGYNELINSGIQGTASDICVNGMNALSELDRDYIRVIMNIHDDVTSYVPDSHLEKGIDEIAEVMCVAANDLLPEINVPIAVELTAGKNWCDQEDVGLYKSTDYIHVDSALKDPKIFMR